MGNIGKYEIRLSWRENVKIEADTARSAPVSSKPPPPKPPNTYSSDKPVGKGAEEGKGETGGSTDSRGSGRKGKDSKGKDDSEGKEAKGGYRRGKVLAKVGEGVGMLRRVDFLQSHREKRTGNHRIGERGTRIVSGRAKMTGIMSTEPGSWGVI